MRLIRLIHKWTGLIAGLFFIISCLTGAAILIGRLTGSHAQFFGLMRKLHCTLFLGDQGRTTIGISTLLMAVEIITGYCLWVKTAHGQIKAAAMRGASWWSGLCRSLSPTRPNKRWGLHVVAGFWAGLLLLLMALTGLTWSFGWFNSLAFALFDTSDSGQLFHTIASLHTGKIFGTTSRVIWLVTALLGASLSVTGLLITLKRKAH